MRLLLQVFVFAFLLQNAQGLILCKIRIFNGLPSLKQQTTTPFCTPSHFSKCICRNQCIIEDVTCSFRTTKTNQPASPPRLSTCNSLLHSVVSILRCCTIQTPYLFSPQQQQLFVMLPCLSKSAKHLMQRIFPAILFLDENAYIHCTHHHSD